MATGGTIPSNRKQTVTFYNTSGIIERHKNIYYVPRFSKKGTLAGTDVRTAWLNAFTAECPPSSVYTAIEISSWSPEDRTLVVKGNIDDFRLVTDEGACLNYLVITRKVTKNNTEATFYYAFFITAVQQLGGSSVQLTTEPDDFTNVFYLHNKHALTATEITNDYTPFSEKMKNCYVKRQHYNRIKIEPEEISVTSNVYEDESYEGGTVTTTLSFSVPAGKVVSNVVAHGGQAGGTFEITQTGASTFNVVYTGIAGHPSTLSFYLTGVYYNFNIEADNIKIFLNQNESFKYKYQYRDMKNPIITDSNDYFTNEEVALIKETAWNHFNDLTLDLRKKIIRQGLSYLVIETKGLDLIPKHVCFTNDLTGVYVGKFIGGNSLNNTFFMPNVRNMYPMFDFPELTRKFWPYIWTLMGTQNTFGKFYARDTTAGTEGEITSGYEMLEVMNKDALAQYVISAYVIKDMLLDNTDITILLTSSSLKITFNTMLVVPTSKPTGQISYDLAYGTGLYLGGFINDPELITSTDVQKVGLGIKYTGDTPAFFIGDNVIAGLVVSGRPNREFEINIEDALKGKTISDLRSNYYDPVLEQEPYQFYSISMLSGYELVFAKNRYYEGVDSTIKLRYYCNINGAVKMSINPVYTVDNYEIEYFNEGLTFTSATSIPLVTDTYTNYIYQNKAQMKNQYAVSGMNGLFDLAQHFFISGPNAVGYSAGKGGMTGGGAKAGYSALLETGNQLSQMTNEFLDIAQSHIAIDMNQKALKADLGHRPDSIKETGSDIMYSVASGENTLFFNHYRIDEVSYNSNCKFLERFGYDVSLYDNINTINRVGWNFVQLISFDWAGSSDIMVSQEENIRKIFLDGVTMLHNKTYLTSGHNYETILEE